MAIMGAGDIGDIANELVKEIMKDKEYYSNSGGVTFSGGEPFYQSTFLKDVLIGCKKKWIKCWD